MLQKIGDITAKPKHIDSGLIDGKKVYKVKVGPIEETETADWIVADLRAAGLPEPSTFIESQKV